MLGAMPRLALAIAIALLVPSLACTKLEPTEARMLTGEQAPDFSLVDQAGETVTLTSLIGEGKPAVLVFYRGHW